MKRHGGDLNAYYQVEEANLRRLHTVWFQLQFTLGPHGCELHGSTCMRIFFNSKYYSTTQYMVGWIRGCRTVDTEEPRTGRADYKLYVDFQQCRESVPLPPALIKGQLSMTVWKRQNWRQWQDHSGFQGWRWRERWMGRTQRIFRAVKIFCMIF